MGKAKVILLLAVLICSSHVKSQSSINQFHRYKFIKALMKSNGETSSEGISSYQANNRIYEFIPFNGDSSRYHTSNTYSFLSANLSVAVCDTNGNLIKELVFKGLGSLNPLFLNDGSFIASTNGNSHYSSSTNQSFRKIPTRDVYKGSVHNIIRCNLNGEIQSLDTFFVQSYIQYGGYDSLEGVFYMLFGDVSAYDSIQSPHKDIFQIGHSTLLKLNDKGQILKHWLFEGEYTRFCTNNNGSICLFGESKEFEKERTISILAYDLSLNKLNWSHTLTGQAKVLDLQMNNHGTCLAVVYKNKLHFNNELVRIDTDYVGSKFLLINFDMSGRRKSVRTAILGNTSILRMSLFDSHLDFVIYKYANSTGEFRWNRGELTSIDIENGSNRLVLSKEFNVSMLYSIPIGFPSEISLSKMPNTYYLNCYIKDTLTINRRKYTATGNPLYKEEYLFMKVVVDTINLTQRFANRQLPISIYPNPTSTSFKYNGSFYSNAIGTTKVYDLQGNLINTYEQKMGAPIDISEIEKGIYIITLEIGKGPKYSFKLIKN